jgi:flagellar hook-associated protein 1
MPSLSSGINTALSAIMANSQAIETIEQNVANANTPGYRRRMPNLSSVASTFVYGAGVSVYTGQAGGGVNVDKIQRFSLDFFDSRYRAFAGESSDWQTRSGVLSQLETTLSETSDQGMIPTMDSFFSSWATLAANPADTALRQQVLDQAQGLTDAFNRRSAQMRQLRSDQDLAITDQVDQINSMAGQIADLNKEIAHTLAVGQQPNDLLDKRDLLLDQLAQSAGAVSYPQKDGSVTVSLNGHMLVSNDSASPLSVQADPGDSDKIQIVWSDKQVFTPSSGTLNGLFTVRDKVIPAQQAGLNQLAAKLASVINAKHKTGYDLKGAAGVDFFDSTALETGNEAATLRLNSIFAGPPPAPEKIAAASASNEPGNSSIAGAIADFRSDKTMMGNGTATFDTFYNAQVTTLGMQVQTAQDNASHNNQVFNALGQQRESVSGVSMDEEAANLSKYQYAYQAAARVMNAYDELLDKIINGMGLVGRS